MLRKREGERKGGGDQEKEGNKKAYRKGIALSTGEKKASKGGGMWRKEEKKQRGGIK